MILPVNQHIRLELINGNHADILFGMVDTNRHYLRTWLSFVDKMQTVDFAKAFVKGTKERNLQGFEYAFIIFENDKPVGRIGIYKIDPQNGIGEIGYWLIEQKQGKGMITQSCEALLHFCFGTLNLNRIELKCATKNTRSIAVPERLSFTKEGVIRQGEWLHDQYVDLYLFSLLKSDWNPAVERN